MKTLLFLVVSFYIYQVSTIVFSTKSEDFKSFHLALESDMTYSLQCKVYGGYEIDEKGTYTIESNFLNLKSQTGVERVFSITRASNRQDECFYTNDESWENKVLLAHRLNLDLQ